MIDSKISAIASARGFGAEIAFAVNADADGVGFHVAFADHEHGVHFHLLGALDFAVDLVGSFRRFPRGLDERAVRSESIARNRVISRHRRW